MCRPQLNPDIAAAPIYTAGTSVEEVTARYGVTDVVKLASSENALGPSPRAVAAIREALAGLERYPCVADAQLREHLSTHLGAEIGAKHIATGNGGSEVLALIAQGFIEAGRDHHHPASGRPTHGRRAGSGCVVLDQAYVDFVDGEDHVNALEYVRAGRYVILVRTLSKSYGLAGLRMGYAVAQPTLAEYLWRARQPFHLSSLALAGAMAALEDTDHLRRSREMILTERQWLHQQLTELGLCAILSQSNFVTFRPGYDPGLVYERLLRRGVVIRPAAFFGMPDWIRVTVGTREQNERFIAALEDVMGTLSAIEEIDGEVGRSQEDGVVI